MSDVALALTGAAQPRYAAEFPQNVAKNGGAGICDSLLT